MHKITSSCGRRLCLLVAIHVAISVQLVTAQATSTPSAITPQSENSGAKVTPRFEVVSIKEDRSGVPPRIRSLTDGYFITDLPLKTIISHAFGVEPDLVSGAPEWTVDTQYDISAKIDEGMSKILQGLPSDQQNVQWRLMLQTMLADRFNLKIEHVAKEHSVYELWLTKDGPKFKEADPNNKYTNGLIWPDGSSGSGRIRMSPGQIIGQGISMSMLIKFLSVLAHQTVIDKTGLTGRYDIKLSWAPEDGFIAVSPDAPSSSSDPSIFEALQKQLGLKLQSAKDSVDTIVIEHIDRPSEN